MINFDGTGESWYDLVEALQGTNETFYVHGVVAFELVESIMEYARNLVEAASRECPGDRLSGVRASRRIRRRILPWLRHPAECRASG